MWKKIRSYADTRNASEGPDRFPRFAARRNSRASPGYPFQRPSVDIPGLWHVERLAVRCVTRGDPLAVVAGLNSGIEGVIRDSSWIIRAPEYLRSEIIHISGKPIRRQRPCFGQA